MGTDNMKVVVISASPRKGGKTQIPMKYVYDRIQATGAQTEFINIADADIECYRGYGIEYNDDTQRAAQLLTDADVWIVGTPIYNSFFSGALKNLFEYVNYKATAGKVAGMVIVAAGNIGFTDVQTLVTQLLSYFRVVANPQAVYITVNEMPNDQMEDSVKDRLKKMIDDTLAMATRLRT